jgi:hypothetical protein
MIVSKHAPPIFLQMTVKLNIQNDFNEFENGFLIPDLKLKVS